jgi:intracellular septation protein A
VKDLLYVVVFMSVVFAMAALILIVSDKLTLRPGMSPEERQAALNKKSARLQRGWAIAFFVMALIALPVHAFGLVEEPLWQRLLYFGLAALVVLTVVSGLRGFSGQRRPGDESLSDDDE